MTVEDNFKVPLGCLEFMTVPFDSEMLPKHVKCYVVKQYEGNHSPFAHTEDSPTATESFNEAKNAVIHSSRLTDRDNK